MAGHAGGISRSPASIVAATALACLAAWAPLADVLPEGAGHLPPPERCLGPGGVGGPPELAALRDRLATSAPLAGYFAGILAEGGVSLCLGEQMITCRGYFEPDHGVIAIRPDLDPVEQLLVVVHELRHVDQFLRGFAPTTEVSMRETARQVFALEADAHAMVLLFAWAELQDGREDAWDAAAGLEHYEDIAVAFAVAAGDGLEAEATLAAFRAWYTSERRLRQYYLSSCTHYLDALERVRRPQPTVSLAPRFFDTLCLMPDGSNYGCHLTAEIHNLLFLRR
jgi:hypothetical protein